MPTAILAEAYCFCRVTKNLECFELCFLWFLCLNILHRTQIRWPQIFCFSLSLSLYISVIISRFTFCLQVFLQVLFKVFLKFNIFFHFEATIKLKTVLESSQKSTEKCHSCKYKIKCSKSMHPWPLIEVPACWDSVWCSFHPGVSCSSQDQVPSGICCLNILHL